MNQKPYENGGKIPRFRVMKRMSFDNPPKPYWVVVEIVGYLPDLTALTMTWEEIYSTPESAAKAIASVK